MVQTSASHQGMHLFENLWAFVEGLKISQLKNSGNPGRNSLPGKREDRAHHHDVAAASPFLQGLQNSLSDEVTKRREQVPEQTGTAKSRRVDEAPLPVPNMSAGQPSVSDGIEVSKEVQPVETISEKDAAGEMRQLIDLVSDKHGPRFLALKTEERSWLMNVHKNMGHPNAQKLRLFCPQLGCSPEILEAINDLECSTCQETKGPEIAKPSAIHPNLDFGDVVGMDGIKWTNKSARQFFFYHGVDQATTFHTAFATKSHTSQDAIRTITQGWINWAGPPGMLVVDAGTDFGTENFHQFLQTQDIRLRMIAPEAHWQNARVERHGGILQSILDKMDQEKALETDEELETALSFATQTQNRWSRNKGYPPEVLVCGKLSKMPGSIMSDGSKASHAIAMQDSPEGIQFRERLAFRERARKAFCEVDNQQSLRRALNQRSRPQRTVYNTGDWVMAWRKDSQWLGPLKVVLQEDKNVIWAVLGNKLFRLAPEHARPLSAVEEVHQSQMPTQLI